MTNTVTAGSARVRTAGQLCIAAAGAMRLLRLIAALTFAAAGACLWAAPGFAEDAKVTVYPSSAFIDDPIAVTVERAAGCDRDGQVKMLFNGSEPLPGGSTVSSYGFHFYGDDMLILGALRPLNIPPAGRTEVDVVCTDKSGKQTTYRSGFERLAAEGTRPTILPFWLDDDHQFKIDLDTYFACDASVTVDGKSVPVVTDNRGSQLNLPQLAPGLHNATVNCNGIQSTYPLAIDFPPGSATTPGADATNNTGSPDRYHPVDVFKSVPTPQTVDFTPVKIAAAVLLGAAVIVLIGFPSEFVNKTIEANQEEINSWFRGARGTLRNLTGKLKPGQWFLVYCGLTALLTTLVDPLAALNLTTLITLLAFVIAVPLTTIVYSGIREAYTRRITGVPGIIHTIPRALLLALVMTIASRIAGFQPGYAYGLVAGYIGLRERRLSAQRDSATVIAGTVALFALSLVSWIALGQVHTQAGLPGAGFPLRLWDGVLCATFLLGVQTLVFGLIPLRFLDGHVLRQWSMRAWALVYAPGIVLFIFLLGLNSETARQRGVASGLISSLVLFLAFGAASMLFWAFFQIRKGNPPTQIAVPQQIGQDTETAHDTAIQART